MTGLNSTSDTWLFPAQTISFNGTLHFFDIDARAIGTPSGTYTLKIFRDDGTNYNYIGESSPITVSSTGIYYYGKCSIEVETGDIIGFKSTGNTQLRGDANANTCRNKFGDITSDSLKSSWGSSNVYDVSAQVHGFKTT